jgi:hypothetical protein
MPAPRRAILANIHESKLDPKVAHVTLDKSGKLVHTATLQETKGKSIPTEKKNVSVHKDVPAELPALKIEVPVAVEKEVEVQKEPAVEDKVEEAVVQQEQAVYEEATETVEAPIEIAKETPAEADVSLSSSKKKSKKKY